MANLIVTYVTAFELQEERDYLTGLHDLFTKNGGNFYFGLVVNEKDEKEYRFGA